MSIILGIAVYKNTMSVAKYNKKTQEEITGTYFVHALETFGNVFHRLSESITEPIERTVIACSDHFDPEYQKKIINAVREYEFGKLTFIYHQTASAYYAWDEHFIELANGEIFGVINKHSNRFHLTLYRKINSVYKAFYIHENPSFDQYFANPALTHECKNFFVNINDSYWIEHTRKLFNAQNVYCSNFSYENGDCTARGAIVKGKHLDRSSSTIITDCIPYSIQTVYNHIIQHTIPAFTDIPFNETVFLCMVNEGTIIRVKQQLPNERKTMKEERAPNGLLLGVLTVAKNENGVESIKLVKIFETYTSLWFTTGALATAAYLLRR